MPINKLRRRPSTETAPSSSPTGEWAWFQLFGDILKFSPATGTTTQIIASGSNAQKIAKLTITGGSTTTGVFTAWQNPEGASILVEKVILDITTASTGASTLDIGTTATSATTASDNLLDGVSGTPAALFDSSDAGLDSGANDAVLKLAAGKWIVVEEKSGDVDGLAATLYIYYTVL